jgi:hypothetical protein
LENFKYQTTGLHLKIPLIDRIAGRESKIQQLDVIIETKKLKTMFFVKLKSFLV